MTLTATQITQMQNQAGDLMHDTCVVQTYTSSTVDSYRQPTVTYPDGSAISCGFSWRQLGNTERLFPELHSLTYDALVRVPIGTTVTRKDRVKLTKRMGVAITNIVFEVSGPVMRGPTCLMVPLRRVEV